MSRLLLNFIMRNEEKNLPRMLASVEPYIVGAVVTDTGSTDSSVRIVNEFFEDCGKPLTVGREPFVDFSQARNAALRLARSTADKIDWDYILLCDCDMELVVPHKRLPELKECAYAIQQVTDRVSYFNIRLLRRDLTCEYVGRTHEVITPPEAPHVVDPVLCWYKDHETGSNRVEKYRRDIELLKHDLEEDPTNPRTVFYMISSLHGAGMIEQARKMCELRLPLGGHPEEVFWTMLHAAQFDEMLKAGAPIIINEYLETYEYRPKRAEPLAYLAAYLISQDRHKLAMLYAREAALMPRPIEVLPIDAHCYEWAALDSWLVAAAKCGSVPDAKTAARMLRKRLISPADRERIMLNIDAVLGGKKK